MAVDIKSLRIGSHVNLCGKRQCITAIDALNGLLGIDAYKTDENGVKYPIGYKVEDVEPISITPELLKELGFENTSCTRRTTYTKGCEYDGFWIEFRNLKDRWDLFVSNNNLDGRTPVRYLHEAESFLGLYNIELINENKNN